LYFFKMSKSEMSKSVETGIKTEINQILHMYGYVDEVMEHVDDLKVRLDLLEKKPDKNSKIAIRELVASSERMTKLFDEVVTRVSSLEKEIDQMKTTIDLQKKSLDWVLEKILNDECDALINSAM
jgi:hypothetical protein